MKKLLIAIAFASAAALSLSSGEEAGHMHGPDGRHIVTAPKGAEGSQFILSHHDMRIEGPDGKSVLGASVDSTIFKKDQPDQVVHTEKNVYEPENEVYGSHMTYSEPGEYVIKQAVTLPSGKKMQVQFPVYVPALEGAAAGNGEHDEHDHHGPNWLLIIGGGIGFVVALWAAFRAGKKAAGGTLAGVVAFSLIVSSIPAKAFASGEEEGHMHGPDGRHIVTQTDAEGAKGSQLKAYPAPNKGESAEQTVEGIKFVLSIENEEMQPDPDLVSVTSDQSKIIGLRTELSKLTQGVQGLAVSGRVSANPNGYIKVTTRSDGRLVSLQALPGTRVKQGQVLAVLESPELAEAQAEYLRLVAEAQRAKSGIVVAENTVKQAEIEVGIAQRDLARQESLAATGIYDSPALESAKQTLSEARARVVVLQDEVKRLEQVLVRYRDGVASGVVAKRDLEKAESEFNQGKATLTEAQVQLKTAEAAYGREEKIATQKLRSAKETDTGRVRVDLARKNLLSAQAALTQARSEQSQLVSLQRITATKVRQLGGTPGGDNRIVITAPIDAEVEERRVDPGQTIAKGQSLFTLLNADLVWVLGEIYERDIPRAYVGQPIQMVADAFPGKVYNGRIAFIHNEVNPATRTTQIRIVIENPGELLKQDMFVRAVLSEEGKAQVTVPTAAIQPRLGLEYVFVQEKEGVFRKTQVRTIKSLGNRTVVDGVEPNRQVVCEGSYQLLNMGSGG